MFSLSLALTAGALWVADVDAAAPIEPVCRAYTSDQDESLPFQLVSAGLPAGASQHQWVRPAAAIYTAPFSAATAEATAHTGVDYVNNDPAVERVLVVAAAAGQVVHVRDGCPQSATFTPNHSRRECGAGWGNQVVIAHGADLYTRYAHLEPDVPAWVGQAVMAGDPVAFMGTSGRAMLRHLHFELGTIEIDPDACAASPGFERIYDPALLGI